jgi:hypothetical protein
MAAYNSTVTKPISKFLGKPCDDDDSYNNPKISMQIHAQRCTINIFNMAASPTEQETTTPKDQSWLKRGALLALRWSLWLLLRAVF